MGLALLAHSSMPLKFWDEAFLTAVFLINCLPSRIINNQSPFERLYGKPPDYTFLRTFGCAVWPNLRRFNSIKLQFRSKKCVFLGYSNMHKGFKCLDPTEGRIYISQDVIFDETVFPFSSLRPNAGARLRQEIALLPPSLLNPTDDFGNAMLLDQYTSPSVATNFAPSAVDDIEHARTTQMQNSGQRTLLHRNFVWPANATPAPGIEIDRASDQVLIRSPRGSDHASPSRTNPATELP